MHLRTECRTRKRLLIPNKPSVLKQQSQTQEEQEAINPEKEL